MFVTRPHESGFSKKSLLHPPISLLICKNPQPPVEPSVLLIAKYFGYYMPLFTQRRNEGNGAKTKRNATSFAVGCEFCSDTYVLK